MITSYQLFCEAISLTDAKKYTQLWYDSGADKIHVNFFTQLFKGKPDTKYRLYYPFEKDNTEEKTVDSLESQITTLLIDNGYSDVDYIGNKTTDKYKRIVKISSVLSKLKQSSLLNKYNANLNRSNKSAYKSVDEYMIVISRHPVDLAGMSTDRGWTSCMNLDDGCNKSYIKEDVVYGTLVAYIIKSNDLNIQKPIARCLIKPFIHSNNNNFKIYLPETSIYGTISRITQTNFVRFINSWCDSNLNKVSKNGKYYKNVRLYADGGFDDINIISDLRKYLEENYEIENNTVTIDTDLDLDNTNLKSLDTGGLKVILYGNLDITGNPNLTSLKGIENYTINRYNIYADWNNIKDVTLRDIILYGFKKWIRKIDDNTIEIDKYLQLNSNVRTLNTDGLKVKIHGHLDLTDMPNLTTLDGLDNFEVEGNIYANWKNIKGITLRQVLLYQYKSDMKWIDDNTIEIDKHIGYNTNFPNTLDTDGLKVIVNGTLDFSLYKNINLKGLENWDVKGSIYADWESIKGLTLKQYILYKHKSDITWIDKNTIEVNSLINISNVHIKSFDTEGLKVIVNNHLIARDNKYITTLEGIENFEIKGSLNLNWRIVKGVSFKQMLLYRYNFVITKLYENTIKIDNSIELNDFGLTSIDTEGLKVIVNGNLVLTNNPNLTSLAGIENFEISGATLVTWRYITDKKIKMHVLHRVKPTIIDKNTVKIDGYLNLSQMDLTSLDTDGLKIIVNGDLDIRHNPNLTSLEGIENFEVSGTIYKDI